MNECRFVWYDNNGNHVVDLKGRLIEIESDCGGYSRNVTIHMIEHNSFDKPPYKTAQQLEEDRGVVVDATTKDIVMRNISKSMEKIEKGDEMSVKIIKPLKEISIDELKEKSEWNRVIIHIDETKKQEIEEYIGFQYGFGDKIVYDSAEFIFNELNIAIRGCGQNYTIPYDIISKIEVSEC